MKSEIDIRSGECSKRVSEKMKALRHGGFVGWDADKCLRTSFPGVRGEALTCGICQFSWCKPSHCGQSQGTKVMSLNTETHTLGSHKPREPALAHYWWQERSEHTPSLWGMLAISGMWWQSS